MASLTCEHYTVDALHDGGHVCQECGQRFELVPLTDDDPGPIGTVRQAWSWRRFRWTWRKAV